MTTNKSKLIISDDGKQITLPIPLGSVVYSSETVCGDFCLFDKENFQKSKKRLNLCCDRNSPCHTRIHPSQPHIVTINNCIMISQLWGDKFFATKKEADAKTLETVDRNRFNMAIYAFNMRDDGYSQPNERKIQE